MKSLQPFRAAIALCLLCAATPALASDFSGIGRMFAWSIFAFTLTPVLLYLVWQNRNRATQATTNAVIAFGVSVFWAPGIYLWDFAYEQWAFTMMPGTLLAELDGEWSALYPFPLLSIGVCTLIIFLFLHWRSGEIVHDEALKE